eukprot:TRINITY_DN30303_c0_g1_i1.p1 TRINITY_DN30303_c0_g1~~TRINITY_DN30303_c0_g1_i1.p1  ORF type:complete len:206 (+),score=50.46 TRINITY_DN30303_c0_g1_i1:73-690(+)
MVLLHSLRTAYYTWHGAYRAGALESILETGVTRVYAGARATDMFLHVNNARYLEYFEFARWHHGARAGVTRGFWNTGVYPVVGAVHIQYMKELKPFQFVDVSTRVVGAHRRSVIIEQAITTQHPKKGRVVHATMMLKATCIRKGRPVDVPDMLDAYGIDREEFAARVRVSSVPGLPDTSTDAADRTPFDKYNEADDVWRADVRKA